MVKEYEVVKPFNGIEEGSIFYLDNVSKKYIFQEDESDGDAYSFSHYCEISPITADNYCNAGFLKVAKAENEEADTRIEKLKEFIDAQLGKYAFRKEKIQRKYEAGKIPTCVKVEHDTVNYNLVKLLNKIKDLLNE